MAHEMLGGRLCAATIGHRHRVEINASDRLIKSHNVNAPGDNIAERILSTIGGRNDQSIYLPPQSSS